MALVTRWFGVTAAGTGDGTSWANRAALFSGGAWSAVIRNFNFTAGVDGLLCLIGPGLYVTNSLVAANFTSGTPSIAAPMAWHGCDAAGVPLSPPNPAWTADMPEFDDSSFPELQIAGNNALLSGVAVRARCIRFTSTTSRTSGTVGAPDGDWCTYTNPASSISVAAHSGSLSNSWCKCVGTQYNMVLSGGAANTANTNVRVIGNLAATGGSRRGVMIAISNASSHLDRVCVVNNVGEGIHVPLNGGQTSNNTIVRRVTIVNCGAGVSSGLASASPGGIIRVIGAYVANCTAAGIDGMSNSTIVQPILVSTSRVRDAVGGPIINIGNLPTDWGIDTSAGTDAAEFVDAAAGDYRIKRGSAVWGKGYGVSDEAGGGETQYVF